jgi:hypothetical protein
MYLALTLRRTCTMLTPRRWRNVNGQVAVPANLGGLIS